MVLNYLLTLEKNKRYVHVINYSYNVVFQEFLLVNSTSAKTNGLKYNIEV